MIRTVTCKVSVLLLLVCTVKVRCDKQNLTGMYISRNVSDALLESRSGHWVGNSSIAWGLLETPKLRLRPRVTGSESTV